MKKFNKPLSKEFLNTLKEKFDKLNIKTDLYRKYLSENNIPIGKAKHHIFPVSLFGNNEIIYKTSLKWHTRLHLLLIADNLDKIKLENELSRELLDIILGGTVRYTFGYKKFLNQDSNFTIDKSWFFKNDLEFYEKYKDIFDHKTRSYFMKELWKDDDFRDNITLKLNEYWNSEEGLSRRKELSDIMLEVWNSKTDKEKIEFKRKMLHGFYSWLDNGGREQLSNSLKERDTEMLKDLWTQDWYREKVSNGRKNSELFKQTHQLTAARKSIDENKEEYKKTLSRIAKKKFEDAKDDKEELKRLSQFYDENKQKQLAIIRMESKVVRRLINVWRTKQELALHSYHEPNKLKNVPNYEKLYKENSNILIYLLGLSEKSIRNLASKYQSQNYEYCENKSKFRGTKQLEVELNFTKPLVTLDKFLSKSEQKQFVKYFQNLK